MKRNLNRIRFLSVPESLQGHFEGGKDFSLDPAIPIPIEIPDSGAPEGEENFNLEELSWEMIAAGMLRVIESGEYPDRADYYRRFVIALRPGILGEFTEAAIIKAHNGDFDSALDILNTLRGLLPHSPSTLLNRALVLEEKAQRLLLQEKPESTEVFTEAEGAYGEALALQPPFPDALFNAAHFYMNRRNFHKARECFSQYIEIGETDKKTEDDEKMEQAKILVEKIDKNDLGDENFETACTLILDGRESEGLAYIKSFIESHPDVQDGWFMLGWALRKLERWEDGAAAFSKALELGSTNILNIDGDSEDSNSIASSDIHNELAICLMEMGDYKAARRELEAALSLDGENIKIISNLGVLALKAGDDDQAAAFFRAALELDPEDPVAKNFFT